MTKTFLNEGDKVEIQGSGKKPYIVRKIGGVVDCSCPAWRNLGGPIDVRVCKHIKANIDPTCLLPQAQLAMGIGGVTIPQGGAPVNLPNSGLGVPMTVAINAANAAAGNGVRLTKTGKISTAVKQVVVKDTAPPCLLAHKWEGEDPTGWWMSEKLDGVRAWWDGENFISRLGNTYHAPVWFKNLLPKVVLDGELFIGRGKFQQTVSVVRKLIPDDKEWLDVTYVMYDAPKFEGKFEERTEYLKTLFPAYESHHGEGIGHVAALEQHRCKGPDHLKEYLAKIESFGGEGVMLRQSGSSYEEGRSSTCLKVKTFFDDEAEVIGYTDGKGKHKGRIGALVCRWKNVEFEVGTGLSDAERKNPPAVGSKITFRYQELTDAKIPRFPSFLSERNYE
jgi:DNA ligase-1